MDWVENFVFKQMNQRNTHNSGSPSRSTVPARILRQSSDGVSWDVVVLRTSGENINLRSDGRPLRPILTHVQDSGTSATIGARVSVLVERFGSRINPVVEVGAGDEDYVQAASGRFSLLSGGGGSCYQTYNEWGVLFD